MTEASPNPIETPTLTSVSRKARSAAPAVSSRTSRSAIILPIRSRELSQRTVKASALGGVRTSSEIIAFAAVLRTLTGAGPGFSACFAAGPQAVTIKLRAANGAARRTNLIWRIPQHMAGVPLQRRCRDWRNMVCASCPCPVTTGRAWRPKKGGPRAAFSNRGRTDQPAFEAVKMQSIVSASFASNSASLCWAESPSVSAREKLAIMPVLHDSLALASSRL